MPPFSGGIYLFANKENTESAGAAVAGNGTACICPIGVLKGSALRDCIRNGFLAFIVDRRVGDE